MCMYLCVCVSCACVHVCSCVSVCSCVCIVSRFYVCICVVVYICTCVRMYVFLSFSITVVMVTQRMLLGSSETDDLTTVPVPIGTIRVCYY